MKIIGIVGQKYNGKDTIGDFLVDNYNFCKDHFAKPVKDGVMSLFGFTYEQLYTHLKDEIDEDLGITPRNAMQWIGTDIFRNKLHELVPNIDDMIWIKIMQKKYKNYKGMLVIPDVRFKNEIEWIKSEGGYIIKVDRPDIISDDNHESEDNNALYYDVKIINDGTIEDLNNKVNLWIQSLTEFIQEKH